MAFNQNRIKYGFYCPSTNQFYTIDNEQDYLAILNNIQKKQTTTSLQNHGQVRSNNGNEQNYEIQENTHCYAQQMDRQVEEILMNPIFHREIKDVELKEYDF